MRSRAILTSAMLFASIALIAITPGTADAQRRGRMNGVYNSPYYNRGVINPYGAYSPYRNGVYGRYWNGYPNYNNTMNRWSRYP